MTHTPGRKRPEALLLRLVPRSFRQWDWTRVVRQRTDIHCLWQVQRRHVICIDRANEYRTHAEKDLFKECSGHDRLFYSERKHCITAPRISTAAGAERRGLFLAHSLSVSVGHLILGMRWFYPAQEQNGPLSRAEAGT